MSCSETGAGRQDIRQIIVSVIRSRVMFAPSSTIHKILSHGGRSTTQIEELLRMDLQKHVMISNK